MEEIFEVPIGAGMIDKFSCDEYPSGVQRSGPYMTIQMYGLHGAIKISDGLCLEKVLDVDS